MPDERAHDGPLRLLFVEDNPADVELIRAKLEAVATSRAFEIESVDRLSAALRRVKSADVVLLDLGLRAVREGAQDFLLKDKVDGALLDRSLRYAIERKRAEQALARLATIMGAICYDCGRKLAYDRPTKGFES